MSKAFLKQRTNGCDTLNPFCLRNSVHLRCVSDKLMSVITQVHKVLSCDRLQWTLRTRHTDRAGMQFKVAFLVGLISVNTIRLPIWRHGIYCLCEQTVKVDRSHYNISLCHHKLIRNFNLFQPYRFSKFSDRLYTCIVNNCYTDTCTQNNLCIIW